MQGFPANASDSRSFMVADAPARSQLANLVAAALTAGTLLVLTPVFRYLPQAALGAVVLVASARIVDVTALRRLWRVRRSDFVLAAVTACGVLVVGVLPGIGVGVAASLLEVLRRAILPPTAVLGRVSHRSEEAGYRTMIPTRPALQQALDAMAAPGNRHDHPVRVTTEKLNPMLCRGADVPTTCRHCEPPPTQSEGPPPTGDAAAGRVAMMWTWTCRTICAAPPRCAAAGCRVGAATR
jgi:MFS superfamily sulfate permease-like transporter